MRRAAANGVNVLALTDHDETAGLPEAQAAAQDVGITLIPGAELSVSWETHTLHILGLRIDASNPTLDAGLASIRSGRDARARQMAAGLAEAGIPGAYDGARSYVTSDRLISRTHFARFLVETGHAREMKDVFKRYLTPGKPGYVKHAWATLSDAIKWIHAAGGVAVLRIRGDTRFLRPPCDDCWKNFAMPVAMASKYFRPRIRPSSLSNTPTTRGCLAWRDPVVPTITDPEKVGWTWATCRSYRRA